MHSNASEEGDQNGGLKSPFPEAGESNSHSQAVEVTAIASGREGDYPSAAAVAEFRSTASPDAIGLAVFNCTHDSPHFLSGAAAGPGFEPGVQLSFDKADGTLTEFDGAGEVAGFDLLVDRTPAESDAF